MVTKRSISRELDGTDRQILTLVQRDSSLAQAEIGKRVGLSTAAVHERVKKLEARGLIRGYCAMVDPAALGLPVTAFVFVEQQPGPNGNALPDRFAELPEVVACHSIAADETFLLKVRVSDNTELERVIAQIRGLDGVGRTRCVVGLTTWFEARPVPPPAPPSGSPDEPPQTVGG